MIPVVWFNYIKIITNHIRSRSKTEISVKYIFGSKFRINRQLENVHETQRQEYHRQSAWVFLGISGSCNTIMGRVGCKYMCSGHMTVRAQGADLASWLVLEYQVWVRVIVMIRVMVHGTVTQSREIRSRPL